jgi:hypothetical protein
MHPELRRMLSSINGTAVHWDHRNFMYEMGLNSRMALKAMTDMLANPPEGFDVKEVEGSRFTLEIRRA